MYLVSILIFYVVLSFQNFRSWKHIYTVGETNNIKSHLPSVAATSADHPRRRPIPFFLIRRGWRWTFEWEKIWVFPKIGVHPNQPILIGFSNIHHPFWGTIIFGNTHICNLLFFEQGIFWVIHLPVTLTTKDDSILRLRGFHLSQLPIGKSPWSNTLPGN